MSSKEELEKENSLILDAISSKIPLTFILAGLFLCMFRHIYIELPGSAMLALGLFWLNHLSLGKHTKIAANISLGLWVAVLWLSYRHLGFPDAGLNSLQKLQIYLYYLATMFGLISIMLTLHYMELRYELKGLGRIWAVTLIGSGFMCLITVGGIISGDMVGFGEASLGMVFAMNVFYAYMISSRIQTLIYGPPRRRKKLDHKRSLKRVPVKGFKHHRKRTIKRKYCLFCYHPFDEGEKILEPVKCTNCEEVTTPFLWKKFQTLEPYVRRFEGLVKNGIVTLFSLLTAGGMLLITERNDYALHIVTGMIGMWVFLAVPLLLMASHISERDKRGPFETLWAMRIHRIQVSNAWISETWEEMTEIPGKQK